MTSMSQRYKSCLAAGYPSVCEMGHAGPRRRGSRLPGTGRPRVCCGEYGAAGAGAQTCPLRVQAGTDAGGVTPDNRRLWLEHGPMRHGIGSGMDLRDEEVAVLQMQQAEYRQVVQDHDAALHMPSWAGYQRWVDDQVRKASHAALP